MEEVEVVIVGGSYAGLSAALLLGRSLRRVLVVDSQQPCNRQTPHSHGFLTRDGETPAAIAAAARAELAHYPTVEVRAGLVTKAAAEAGGFRVETQAGEVARKLVLATGVTDQLPAIPGVAECWGISVLHCPYCHGYEVRGKRLGLLANGSAAEELVLLIRNWSRHLTLFTNGPADFTAEQQALITARQVPVVEQPIAALEHHAGYLTAVRTTDGQQYPQDAIFARFPVRQSNGLAAQLGCGMTEAGHIQASEVGATSVSGVFAAGDATTLRRQVAAAVSAGAMVGAWVNRELISEGVYSEI